MSDLNKKCISPYSFRASLSSQSLRFSVHSCESFANLTGHRAVSNRLPYVSKDDQSHNAETEPVRTGCHRKCRYKRAVLESGREWPVVIGQFKPTSAMLETFQRACEQSDAMMWRRLSKNRSKALKPINSVRSHCKSSRHVRRRVLDLAIRSCLLLFV
jgi:hypothetical protein